MYVDIKMDRDVQETLAKYIRETNEGNLEIDYDKFFKNGERKLLVEKFPKKELYECIFLSELIVIAERRMMLSAEWKTPGNRETILS